MTPDELEWLRGHAVNYAKHIGKTSDIDIKATAEAYERGYRLALRKMKPQYITPITDMNLLTPHTIKIKPLRDGFIMPKKASDGSAAYDALMPYLYKLQYGRQIVPLGFAIEMPSFLEVDNRPRSGYSAFGLKCVDRFGVEHRISAMVHLGTIDSDYRDEIGCILEVTDESVKDMDFFIEEGQALSQLMFNFVPVTNLVLTDTLSETSRKGGFGKQNNEHVSQDNKKKK